MSRRVSGLEIPSADEFRANPSLRTVSSFFVGWVFIVSLIYLAKSPAVRFLRRRLSAAVDLVLPKPAKSLEQVEGNDGEENKLRGWLIETLLGDDDVNADPLNFVFVLTVFAAVGSLSMYGSLLTFRPPGAGDDALCAFVIAWGDMSAQSMRIAGLTRLSLDLRALSVRRRELFLMWAVLFASLILMFVSNGLSGGVLVSVPELRNTALCYRRHYVATAVPATVLNLLLEIYVTLRFVFLLVPAFLQTKDKIHALLDIRIARSLSFLLMDLLTMVPRATFISIPADFIPFSISALIVLAAFNYNSARALSELSRTDSIPSTTLLNLGRSSTMRASRPPISSSRRTTINPIPPPVPRKTLSNGYIRYNPRLLQSLGMHPFSSASLQRRESTDFAEMSFYPPETALTWGSADARSVQEARIELAFRNTKFGSVSPAKTPEYVPSPGSPSWWRGAIPRPNPTSREEFATNSMYVDDNGNTHVNVHPDEFPLPPLIFPLPPPRIPGVVLPKLRIVTGTDTTSGTLQSVGIATPRSISLRRRNSYNSNQSEPPVSGVPSVVYGSDIVSASGSRNMLHNPSLRQGTLRSSTIGDDLLIDDSTDESFDMLERSGGSSQFTMTPVPISAKSGKGLSSGRTFNMGESNNGLSIVKEEGSIGSATGKRSSFAMRDKGKSRSAGKKVSIALSSRRSRRSNSVDGSDTLSRSGGSGAGGDGGQWGTVPIMVVEPIPTSPISAPVFPTDALYLGLLMDKGTDSGTERGTERRTDRGTDRVERGSSRGMSSAVRGRTRTRLVPRGPRSPEQANSLSAEEELSMAYTIAPEGEPFVRQD